MLTTDGDAGNSGILWNCVEVESHRGSVVEVEGALAFLIMRVFLQDRKNLRMRTGISRCLLNIWRSDSKMHHVLCRWLLGRRRVKCRD